MSSKLRYLLGAAACCSLLASCGGGNNDTPTPTPTETPTPTPTETPTPTQAKFDFSEDFEISTLRMYIFAYFTPNSGGDEVFSDGRFINDLGGLAFDTDPERVRYRFIQSEDIVEFAAADRVSASATERVYQNASGRLILQTPFQYVLRAQLQKTDPYIRETVPGELRSRRVLLFANTVTTTDAIASTLEYTGQSQIAGGASGTTKSDAVVQPTSTITATPDDDEVTVEGSIPITVNINGTNTLVATMPISTTFTEGTSIFGAAMEDTANGFEGTYIGTFAGPNREEMLILFRFAHDDGRKFLGSFIGKRN